MCQSTPTSFPMVWQVSQWGFAMENGAFRSMIYLSKIVLSSSQTVSLRAGINQYSIWHPIHIPFDIPIIYPTHIPSAIHFPFISHWYPIHFLQEFDGDHKDDDVRGEEDRVEWMLSSEAQAAASPRQEPRVHWISVEYYAVPRNIEWSLFYVGYLN